MLTVSLLQPHLQKDHLLSIMLCAIRKIDDQSVLADLVDKSTGPFFCPECRNEVSLRKSKIRTSHFSHKGSFCHYGIGESESHRKCKLEIYKALSMQPNVKKLALERSLQNLRPDISAYINGVPVAIEVQLSAISAEAIAYRTAEYARKGVYVLWLGQWTPYLDGEHYNPRLWEMWLHAAYFGRVYYWVEGLSIVPYRFETIFKPGNGSRDKTLPKKVKRHRRPVRGKRLNLLTDFKPKTRASWETALFDIVAAKLFMEEF